MGVAQFSAGFLADEILKTHPWDPLLAIGVLATVALVPAAIAIGISRRRRRTQQLRAEFGPDYDIAVNQAGDWRLAEKQLRERRKAEGRDPSSHSERAP